MIMAAFAVQYEGYVATAEYPFVAGKASDEQLRDLFAHCRAFLIPCEEDFGITAVEALASGKPVALVVNGAAKQITKDPLGSSQILGLLREIAPTAAAGAMPGTPQNFSYELGEGTVEVHLNALRDPKTAAVADGFRDALDGTGAGIIARGNHDQLALRDAFQVGGTLLRRSRGDVENIDRFADQFLACIAILPAGDFVTVHNRPIDSRIRRIY